jgi:exonuclease SbcC
MLPIRLELKNFLAYRSPDPVRFDGIHLACLTGPNGAGKSTLLDAITWALWGKARAKRDDDMVHLGQQDMHVQLDFEQEGTLFRVIRKRARRKASVGTLDLFAQVEGEWVTQTEPSVRETQAKIDRLLRLDYEIFTHSAFLQQGKADAFTTKAPAQRKQILADILGLAQWEVYEAAVKEQLKAIESDLKVAEMRIHDIEQELKQEPQLKAAVTEAQTAQAEALALLEAAEERLKVVAGAPAQMQTARAAQAEAERRLREHERDLTALHQEIDRQRGRIAGFQAVMNAQAEIEAGYATLQAARQADSDLADKLLQLSDFDRQQHDLEMQLQAARADLEREAGEYQARIEELGHALELADPDELSVVQSQVYTLEQSGQQRDELQAEMQALAEESAARAATLKSKEAEGKKQNERLASLQSATEALCPTCGQPLDDDQRAALIAEIEADLEARRAEWRADRERISAIKSDTKGVQERMTALEGDLKRLSPLMERAGVLQAQIDAADNARGRISTEQSRLESIGQMLAEESYAAELRAQLAGLVARRGEIGYDRDSHDTARQQLTTFRDYESRQKQLELAQSALPDVEAALEGALLRGGRLEAALTEGRAQIAALETEIAGLSVLVQEEKARREEVNRLRMVERTQNNRLVSAQQSLAALESSRARKAELEKRLVEQREQALLYEELRLAFSKNGVPAMIIEAAIPELEDTANRLLSRMTDGRMSLTLRTQREKASGEGVTETLEIQIADELGTRSYELYSGGEAFRINFALRVALSQLLARRAGAHLRTLFIDEGFGTQDEDGRNKLVEAITAIQEDFDLILVITHMDDLRDSFPVHVVVEKTANGSRVSVR